MFTDTIVAFFIHSGEFFYKVMIFPITLLLHYLFYLEFWTYFELQIDLICNLLKQNDLQN